MTLHDRIRAVAEDRLRLAREATAGPWESSGPDTIAEWSIYATKRGWIVATASVNSYPNSASWRLRGGITGDEANRNAAHIAANDPADAILSAEHALGILERHAPSANGHYCNLCMAANGDNADYPCCETLALATRWRVEVDG